MTGAPTRGTRETTTETSASDPGLLVDVPHEAVMLNSADVDVAVTHLARHVEPSSKHAEAPLVPNRIGINFCPERDGAVLHLHRQQLRADWHRERRSIAEPKGKLPNRSTHRVPFHSPKQASIPLALSRSYPLLARINSPAFAWFGRWSDVRLSIRDNRSCSFLHPLSSSRTREIA